MTAKQIQSYTDRLLSVLANNPAGLKGLDWKKSAGMMTAHYVLARRKCLAEKLVEATSGGPRRTTRYVVTDKGIKHLQSKDVFSRIVDKLKFDFGSESDLTMTLDRRGKFDDFERYIKPWFFLKDREGVLIDTMEVFLLRDRESSVAEDASFDIHIQVRTPRIDRSLIRAYIFFRQFDRYLNVIEGRYLVPLAHAYLPLLQARSEDPSKRLSKDESGQLLEYVVTQYFIRSPEALAEMFLVADHFDSLGYSTENRLRDTDLYSAYAEGLWPHKIVPLQTYSRAKWPVLMQDKRRQIQNSVEKLLFASHDRVKREVSIPPWFQEVFRRSFRCNDICHALHQVDSKARRAFLEYLPPYRMDFKFKANNGEIVDLTDAIVDTDRYQEFQNLRNSEKVKTWVTRIMSKFPYGNFSGISHWILDVPLEAFGITPLGISTMSGFRMTSHATRWHPIGGGFLFGDLKLQYDRLGILLQIARAVRYDNLMLLKELFERLNLDNRGWFRLWGLFKKGRGHRWLAGRSIYLDWGQNVPVNPMDRHAVESWERSLDERGEGPLKWFLDKVEERKRLPVRQLIEKACTLYAKCVEELRWSHQQSVKWSLSEVCKSARVRWSYESRDIATRSSHASDNSWHAKS